MRRDLLVYSPIVLGSILRLGIPLLAGNLSIYLYRLADSIMIGRLGVEQLAAIGVASVYTALHEMFVWPVGLGAQAIASRRFGRSGAAASAAAAGVLTDARWAGLAAGTFAFALSLFAPLLVPAFAAASAGDALGYVAISRIAFPVMGLAAAHRGYLGAVHRTRVIMLSIVTSNALNVLGNAIFIYGWGPAPALGVRGAAVGTVLAHLLNVAILVLAVRSRGAVRIPWTLRLAGIGAVLRLGAPVSLQNAFAMGVILAFQAIMGTVGAAAQGVTHAIFSVFRLNKTLVGGFANGTSILVGNALGARDDDRALRAIRSQQMLAGVIGMGVTMFTLGNPGLVGAIFALEAPADRLFVDGLRFFAIFFLIEIMAYSLEVVFTHNGYGHWVLVSEVATNLLGTIGTAAVAVLVFGLGHRGGWAGFALYQVGHAVLLMIAYRRRRWLSVSVESAHG